MTGSCDVNVILVKNDAATSLNLHLGVVGGVAVYTASDTADAASVVPFDRVWFQALMTTTTGCAAVIIDCGTEFDF